MFGPDDMIWEREERFRVLMMRRSRQCNAMERHGEAPGYRGWVIYELLALHACLCVCMFLSSWPSDNWRQCCDEWVCSCSETPWYKQGKKDHAYGFMALLFLFWESWFHTNMVHYVHIYVLSDVLHLHASTIGTLLYTIIAYMNINAMESVFSSQTDTLCCASIFACPAQPSLPTTFAICHCLSMFNHKTTQTSSFTSFIRHILKYSPQNFNTSSNQKHTIYISLTHHSIFIFL